MVYSNIFKTPSFSKHSKTKKKVHMKEDGKFDRLQFENNDKP